MAEEKYKINSNLVLKSPLGEIKGKVMSVLKVKDLKLIEVMTDVCVNGWKVNVFTEYQLDVLTGVRDKLEKLYCENCGREIPPGADKCEVCWYPVPKDKRYLI